MSYMDYTKNNFFEKKSLNTKIYNGGHDYFQNFDKILLYKIEEDLINRKMPDDKPFTIFKMTLSSLGRYIPFYDYITEGGVADTPISKLIFGATPLNKMLLHSKKFKILLKKKPYHETFESFKKEFVEKMNSDFIINVYDFHMKSLNIINNENLVKDIKNIIETMSDFTSNLYTNIFTKYFKGSILNSHELNNIKDIKIYSLFDNFDDSSIFMNHQNLRNNPYYKLNFNVYLHVNIQRNHNDIPQLFNIPVFVFPYAKEILIPIVNFIDYSTYNDYKILDNLQIKYYNSHYDDVDQIYDLIQSYLCVITDEMFNIVKPSIVKNTNRIEHITIDKINFSCDICIGNIFSPKIINISFNDGSQKFFYMDNRYLIEVIYPCDIPILLNKQSGYHDKYYKLMRQLENDYRSVAYYYENVKNELINSFLNNNDIIEKYKEQFCQRYIDRLHNIYDRKHIELDYKDKIFKFIDEIDKNNVEIQINDNSLYNDKHNKINYSVQFVIKYNMKEYYGTSNTLCTYKISYSHESNENIDIYASWPVYENKFNSCLLAELKNKKIIKRKNECKEIVKDLKHYDNNNTILIEYKDIIADLFNDYCNYIQKSEKYKDAINKFEDCSKLTNDIKFFDELNNVTNNKNIQKIDNIEMFFDQLNYYIGTQFNVSQIK